MGIFAELYFVVFEDRNYAGLDYRGARRERYNAPSSS